MRQKKKCLGEFLRSFPSQIYSFKNEIGYLREKVKEKNNVIRTMPNVIRARDSREYKSSSLCERPKLDKIS